MGTNIKIIITIGLAAGTFLDAARLKIGWPVCKLMMFWIQNKRCSEN
jgi:hypothetical protein